MKRIIHIASLVSLLSLAFVNGSFIKSAETREISAERWQPVGPNGGGVNVVHRGPAGVILAGTNGGGIYRASALDLPWTQVTSYQPAAPLNQSFVVYSFASNSSATFATTNQGGFRSTDSGVTWRRIEGLTSVGSPFDFAANDNVVVAAMGSVGFGIGPGVWRSLNGGTDWVAANLGLTVGTYTVVRNAGATFFAVGPGAPLYRSTNNAESWTPVGVGLPLSVKIFDIEIVTGATPQVFVATANGIFRSDDNGATFNEFSRGLTARDTYDLSFGAGDLFAATSAGVFYSTDRGLSWLARHTGITTEQVTSLSAGNGKHLAATMGRGVFVTENNGANWRASNVNLNAHTVEKIQRLSNGTVLAAMIFNGSIWRSTDFGLTYQPTMGAPNEANCFIEIGTKVLAGTTVSGLYISSDYGANWAVRNRTLPATGELVKIGTMLFAATEEGVFRSTDEGGVWTPVNTGLPESPLVSAMIATGDGRLFIGTPRGVFFSNNQGGQWMALNNGLTELDVTSLLNIGSVFYAGTTNGMFKLNAANAWTPINNGLPAAPNRWVRTLRGLGNALVFAGLPTGVYYTLDDGQTWTPFSDGLIHGDVQTIELLGTKLAAGTAGNSIFNISLSDFDCRFSITPTSRTHTAAASADTVAVTDAFACGWMAGSNAPWITVTAGASGLRNGTVTYNLAANTTGANRTGTLTIAGQTFTVTQTAQAPNPIPVVSTVAPNVFYEGDGFPRTITINGSNFVSGAEVRLNTATLATTFVSAAQLTAVVTPGVVDFAALGLTVSVFNPTPGGGGSRETAPIILERKTVSVSAASYEDTRTVAPDSIVAMFGTAMGTGTEAARTSPLPTTLGGATVRVKDRLGVERLAPLFFTSPNQINYLVPPETATGAAEVRVTRADGKRFLGFVTVALNAAGLFAANANGSGVAAALVLRITASGALSYENVARYDTALSRYVAEPINFGVATDQVFLVLYGTGLRTYRNVLTTQLVTYGGSAAGSTNVAPLFIGAAPGFFGLDQINVPLPRSFAGRGAVDLRITLDDRASNVVSVAFR